MGECTHRAHEGLGASVLLDHVAQEAALSHIAAVVQLKRARRRDASEGVPDIDDALNVVAPADVFDHGLLRRVGGGQFDAERRRDAAPLETHADLGWAGAHDERLIHFL